MGKGQKWEENIRSEVRAMIVFSFLFGFLQLPNSPKAKFRRDLYMTPIMNNFSIANMLLLSKRWQMDFVVF